MNDVSPLPDIGPAGPSDLEDLVRFNAAMALETERKELDLETLRQGVAAVLARDDRGFYLVARSRESHGILGQLLVTFEWSDWRNRWFWWIQSVFVEKEWRGKGVYTALHEKVRELARERGNVYGIRLYVDEDNRIAQEAYRRLGMEASRYRMYEEPIRERDAEKPS